LTSHEKPRYAGLPQMSSRRSVQLYLVSVLTVTAGCSGPAEAPFGPLPDPAPTVNLGAGKAVLGGTVRDADGVGIANARLEVAETTDATLTEADGTYLLGVAADTTLSIQVTAEGFSPTFLPGVRLGEGESSTGFDALLLTPSTLEAYNLLPSAPIPDGRATIAVSFVSLGGLCSQDGATVDLAPSLVDTVLYVPTSTDDALLAPDPSLMSVQPDAPIAAYVLGVEPPSIYDDVSIEKTACSQNPFPIAFDRRTYEGTNSVAVGALTQVTIFIP
jgi:hypothetical protein